MPSETTTSPGAATPVLDDRSSRDPWNETGESRRAQSVHCAGPIRVHCTS